MAFFALGAKKEVAGGTERRREIGKLQLSPGTVASVTHTHLSQGRPKEQELALHETVHCSLGPETRSGPPFSVG